MNSMKATRLLLLIFGALVIAFFAIGCAKEPEPDAPEPTATTSGSEEPEEEVSNEPADPFLDNRLMPEEVTDEMKADMAKEVPADGEEVAVFDTSAGKVIVMFYEKVAPKTVANFKKLANDDFYNGTRFHRCIPGFMIQGGDPESKDMDKAPMWGTGGPGYTIDDELNPIRHEKGVLSMAHAGPNTGGSQFFIMDGEAGHLDYVHTAFGRVVSGQDVVQKIIATGDPAQNGKVEPGDAIVIKSIEIMPWPVK